MKLTTIAIIAALATAGAALTFSPSGQLAFRHEPGVETQLGFAGAIDFLLAPEITADVNIGFGFLENMGVTHYRLGVRANPLWGGRAGIEAAFEHDQWVDWFTGENRAIGMVRVEPLRGLELGVGAAWRAPVTGDSARPDAYASPFNWSSDNPEWNLLYRVRWQFLSGPRLALGAYISNHDAFTIHNPQQVPFGVDGSYSLGEDVKFYGRLGSDIKGLSGALLDLGEVSLDLGVKRAF